MDWAGHVAIVTGAGSGIGQGIAARFAEVGAEVVIAEVNEARGAAVAAQLQQRTKVCVFDNVGLLHLLDGCCT